jgi:hypothetical protein
MRSALAIVVCCGLAAIATARALADDQPGAAPAAPSAAPPAAAQTEAEATCDKLAAAPVPLSPEARHHGDIDWPQAITACTQAIKDDP